MPVVLSTPGVYVEEVSLLPPSVVEVGTAIPAFIGYTEKGQLLPPIRIESMVDYAQFFGGPNLAMYTVTVTDGKVVSASIEEPDNAVANLVAIKAASLGEKLTDKLGDIIANQITKVVKGRITDRIDPSKEEEAAATPEEEEEEEAKRAHPSDEAIKKGDKTKPLQASGADYGAYLLYHQVQMHFTNGGGACYIASAGNYDTTPATVDLTKALDAIAKEDEPTLLLFPDAAAMADNDRYDVYDAALLQCSDRKDRFTLMDVAYSNANVTSFRTNGPADNLNYGAAYTPYLNTSIVVPYDETQVVVNMTTKGKETTTTLAALKAGTTNQLYNTIKNQLAQNTLTLPPTGAMSGIYARVDRDRGVWKAPANVGVMGIIGPSDKISDGEQESLNKDYSGKSINAIRSFPNKGTLVWGARTLDGNSNEWRYVSVRRLFIMVEESIQEACAFAVFEPNTATTWLKVKAMIESYLYGLWQKGALAGASPKDAYSVQVGLGITMTNEDIYNGLMLVTVGIAAVRPAEFILLQFSHKMISEN